MTSDPAGKDERPRLPFEPADPWLWLEEVDGPLALAWVRARNGEALARLASGPAYSDLHAALLAMLDSDARIPLVEQHGPHFYNFWRDASHPRGLWRRTTPDDYRKDEPAWETLIDLDALNAAEGINWVWQGADCLKPADPRDPVRHVLVALSRGGADATVTREFDLVGKRFVADGFVRPEAKGSLTWKDADTVYACTDFGPGSTTASGYARIAKEWKRGTRLEDAAIVFEGEVSDVAVDAVRNHARGEERDFVVRAMTFFRDELYVRDAHGTPVKIEVPDGAKKAVHRRWLLVEPREPWTLGETTWPAGSLLAAPFDAWMAGSRDIAPVFLPSATVSLASWSWTRHHLLLDLLDDVKSRVEVATPADGGWTRAPLAGAPAFGTIGIAAVDDDASDAYFMTVTDYLTPTTLHIGDVDGRPEPVKSTPAFFDAPGLAIAQHFATSADGTRVPYFLVGPKDLALDGSHPTLLYGYGGFEIALTPSYSGNVGRAWLTEDGRASGRVFVVANIRGGGEYGPAWHQAALRENRHRAYEDFAAVARDLVARGVTVPARLGIQGGSNGGLLVGNMLTRHPELFGAVVCQVPLLDMKRYSHLLAGASWMDEYGDPDGPDWSFLRACSPYQNVARSVRYPPILLATSTRDDRVHPGHARKMAARLRALGHEVLYHENIEGGHGGGADNAQLATMAALSYTFLKRHLDGDRA